MGPQLVLELVVLAIELHYPSCQVSDLLDAQEASVLLQVLCVLSDDAAHIGLAPGRFRHENQRVEPLLK